MKTFGVFILAALASFLFINVIKHSTLRDEQPGQPLTVDLRGIDGNCYSTKAWTGWCGVAEGIYEVDVWAVDEGKTVWVWKNNLILFKKEHPNERIVAITPSVFFQQSVRGDIVDRQPQKYFIFTEPKQIASGKTPVEIATKGDSNVTR